MGRIEKEGARPPFIPPPDHTRNGHSKQLQGLMQGLIRRLMRGLIYRSLRATCWPRNETLATPHITPIESCIVAACKRRRAMYARVRDAHTKSSPVIHVPFIITFLLRLLLFFFYTEEPPCFKSFSICKMFFCKNHSKITEPFEFSNSWQRKRRSFYAFRPKSC